MQTRKGLVTSGILLFASGLLQLIIGCKFEKLDKPGKNT